MHMLPDSDTPNTAAALQSMTLLATLQAAADVCEAVTRRRAGQDPAAQEAPAVARPALWRACYALEALRRQLRASLVHVESHSHVEGHVPGEASLAASVRRFDVLMKLGRAARVLHAAHQRLMSLYPAVPEALLEDARRLHDCAERLAEGDAARPPGERSFEDVLADFLAALGRFAEALRRALAADA